MNYLPIVGLFLLLLDQVSKKLVVWQNLPYQQNSGLAFLIPSIVIIPILITWFKSNRHSGLLLILIGGLSNLLDRLFSGFVIDWIFLPFFPFSVFNLADIYIAIGLLLYLISIPKLQLKPPKKHPLKHLRHHKIT